MRTSDKTGIVFKISIVLFVLLATVVYKLNDYFKEEKNYSMQSRLRGGVVLVKTTVGSQLSQLRNTLTSYDSQLEESSLNWVQLDPFFAIAALELQQGRPVVRQLRVRSGTPAERWNVAYLEKALAVNQARTNQPVLTQLFQDKSGRSFLILRFKTSADHELALVGAADYFQKFFDLERGEKSTLLMATAENMLAAHSVADYVGSPTEETNLSVKKYIFEKEEIPGTNLSVISYAPKSRVSGGFAVPWSVAGIVAGFGCILLAIIFYSLDPIEKRIARYKKQERDQIYKDTLGLMATKPQAADFIPSVVKPAVMESPKAEPGKSKPPSNFYAIQAPKPEPTDEVIMDNPEAENILAEEVAVKKEIASEQFLTLSEEKIDLADIEKALALDDFDGDVSLNEMPPVPDLIEKNLTPQKISLSSVPVARPDFVLEKKEFQMDAFKVHVRRPEKS